MKPRPDDYCRIDDSEMTEIAKRMIERLKKLEEKEEEEDE